MIKKKTMRSILVCIVLLLLLSVSLAKADTCWFCNKEKAEQYYAEGNKLYTAKQYEKAREKYSKAIEDNHLEPKFFNAKGLTFYLQNNYEESIIWFLKAVDLDQKPVYYLNIGNAYYNLKQDNKAIENFNQVLKLDPGYAVALKSRGLSYYFLKQYTKSVLDFNQYLKTDPKNAEVYYYRARSWKKAGELELAEKDYTTAIKLAPSTAKYYDYRGRFYYDQKKHRLSAQDFTVYLEKTADDKYGFRLRGVNYFLLKNFDQARKDFLSTIRIDPENEYARYLFVCTYLAENKYAKVAELADRYLKIINTGTQSGIEYYNMVAVLWYFALTAEEKSPDAKTVLTKLIIKDKSSYIAVIDDFLSKRVSETEFLNKINLKNKTLPNALVGLAYFYDKAPDKALPFLKWVKEKGSLANFLYEPAVLNYDLIEKKQPEEQLVKEIRMEPNPVMPGDHANMKVQFQRINSKKSVGLQWYVFKDGNQLVGPIEKTIPIDTTGSIDITPFTIPTMAKPGDYTLILKIKDADRLETAQSDFRIK